MSAFVPKGKKQFAEGFALFDLLIVAVILGILAMIAVPQVQSLISENRLNGSAGEVVTGLQYAANLAVRYQRPFAVKADSAGNWFSVCESAVTPPLPGDPPVQAEDKCILQGNSKGYVVLNPFDKTWYVRDFDEIDAFQGVRIMSVPAGNQVIFYPDGHAGASDSEFVVSLNEKQRTITVNSTTGRITVQ